MENPNAEGWYRGLNRVYEYIDGHLAEDLSLARLSSLSGYSEFHFHRLFHAMTGGTLHEYVLERRVTAAAERLLYGQCSITRTALECGFSSSSSFARSFQKLMGCPPSAYRKSKERKRPLTFREERSRAYRADPGMDALFSLRTMPDLHVAGIACRGLSPKFESGAIQAAFSRLFIWLQKRGLIGPGLCLMGLTLDTPEVTPLSGCRYFACAAVRDTALPEGEVFVRLFSTGGTYACFSMTRTRPDFPQAFFALTDYLYGYRMPLDGLYPDNRPFIEMYSREGPDIAITFCVPVRRQEESKK